MGEEANPCTPEDAMTNYMFKSNGRIIANVKSNTKPRVVGIFDDGDTMYSFYDGMVTIFATELEEV